MIWKTINGGRYLYKSRRVNGRVVTEYHGAGEIADLIDQSDREENRRIKAQREAERAELRALEEQDQADSAIFDQVAQVITAFLLDAGCHKHHGQWRRSNGQGPSKKQ